MFQTYRGTAYIEENVLQSGGGPSFATERFLCSELLYIIRLNPLGASETYRHAEDNLFFIKSF